MKTPPLWLIAAGAVALLLIFRRQLPGVAGELAGAVIDTAEGATVGAVTAIGEKAGIPRTDYRQCQLDKARGDYWAASFSCPAADLFAPVDYSVLPAGIADFIAANS